MRFAHLPSSVTGSRGVPKIKRGVSNGRIGCLPPTWATLALRSCSFSTSRRRVQSVLELLLFHVYASPLSQQGLRTKLLSGRICANVVLLRLALAWRSPATPPIIEAQSSPDLLRGSCHKGFPMLPVLRGIPPMPRVKLRYPNLVFFFSPTYLGR